MWAIIFWILRENVLQVRQNFTPSLCSDEKLEEQFFLKILNCLLILEFDNNFSAGLSEMHSSFPQKHNEENLCHEKTLFPCSFCNIS